MSNTTIPNAHTDGTSCDTGCERSWEEHKCHWCETCDCDGHEEEA